MDASPPAPMAASSPPPAPASAGQEPVARLNTPVRAPDLGTGGGRAAHGGTAGTYPPMCQVDHCSADLTSAKAYHRRHKICVAHSRASETPVAGVAQRFCQMCSRFHPLAEFDGHKRSCRRRLAHARSVEQRRARIWPPGLRLQQENAPIVAQDVRDLIPAIRRL